ncbi:hypothetical protein GCM10008090_12860 [Arenicella chitinivorans]|uniref:Uncharacterized protein n=1 Tax=Arenicella chitinivorans TaxID=1329800 RepID=A0A918VJT9_9GAMM|nr:hypothetical protein GCM10008090_12860 [Arenicella chitinivorans]
MTVWVEGEMALDVEGLFSTQTHKVRLLGASQVVRNLTTKKLRCGALQCHRTATNPADAYNGYGTSESNFAMPLSTR